MTITDINRFYHKNEEDILNYRFHDAVARMRGGECVAAREKVAGEIESTMAVYGYLLDYFAQGVDDPHRENMLNDIALRLLKINDTMHEVALRDVYSAMSSAARTIAFMGKTIAQFASECRLSQMAVTPQADNAILSQSEAARTAFFKALLTTAQLSQVDKDAVADFFADSDVPTLGKAHIVSALYLGCHYSFDVAKIDLLMNVYATANEVEVKMRALIALFLLALRYCKRLPLYRAIVDRLRLLTDDTNFFNNIKMVVLQYVRCRDTERISRKMESEFLTDIRRMAKATNNFSDIDNLTIEDIRENPEWQEQFENSDIAKRMREFSDIQAQGGDVFMTTFSHLKNFPFFNELSNWFAPFDPHRSDVNKNDAAMFGKMAEMMMMCNSDKYSLLFALGQLPQQQRSLIENRMGENYEQYVEAQLGESDKQGHMAQNVVMSYMQDLYRFFRLYSGKDEFDDPFATSAVVSQVPVFNGLMNDAETVAYIANFYFKREYYAEAIEMLEALLAISQSSSETYEKLGYCHQMLKQYGTAIEMYDKALMFNPDNVWTLRHVALCHKITGNVDLALSHYRSAEALAPNNVSLLLNIGHLLLNRGETAEALKYYYKVDYLDEKKHRAWRPIAWSEFVMGNYEKSAAYYERIMADDPTTQDKLNYGHLLFAQRNTARAINAYLEAVRADGMDALRADFKVLQDQGVTTTDLNLLVERLKYLLD